VSRVKRGRWNKEVWGNTVLERKAISEIDLCTLYSTIFYFYEINILRCFIRRTSWRLASVTNIAVFNRFKTVLYLVEKKKLFPILKQIFR